MIKNMSTIDWKDVMLFAFCNEILKGVLVELLSYVTSSIE